MTTPLFDPLRYLRNELRVGVELGPRKTITLRFDRKHETKHQYMAREVADRWESLLVLQLERGGASVRKLLAQGRVRLEKGECVVVE